MKNWRVNIVDIMGRMVSITATHHSFCRTKIAIDNMQTDECNGISIKLYL
jgi:hypothetical protein